MTYILDARSDMLGTVDTADSAGDFIAAVGGS